jgi:hypothetical protein
MLLVYSINPDRQPARRTRMSNGKKTTKRLSALAAAIGLAVISTAAVASASTPAPKAQADTQVGVTQGAVPSNEATEVETPSDESADGIDHQFEGEEVGDNGDGIADADDATEAEEVEGTDDEEVDGIDHQFEGEEVGNNGDGIADADDAAEAAAING